MPHELFLAKISDNIPRVIASLRLKIGSPVDKEVFGLVLQFDYRLNVSK